MPRRNRILLTGDFHHVWGRGVGGRSIFCSDSEKHDFLARLDDAFVENDVRCVGYSVLSNHYHLQSASSVEQLSAAMHDALGGYAQAATIRWRWTGHVFEGRFRSRPIHTSADAADNLIYVLGNEPLAGIVSAESLIDSPMSSFGATMGAVPKLIECLDVDAALNLFSPDPDAARTRLDARLRDYVAKKQSLVRTNPPLAILTSVCKQEGVAVEDVLSGSQARPVSRARRRAIEALIAQAGQSNLQIARLLRIDRSTVNRVRLQLRALSRR